VLEAKSPVIGYDIVVPSASPLAWQIAAGAYRVR
jgi:hypothetical protein